MARVSDVRPLPGDVVILRGAQPAHVFFDMLWPQRKVGTIMPNAMGMVLATAPGGWTYVLWSVPCIIGWSYDGYLRKVKV